jgi:hypothetical protein
LACRSMVAMHRPSGVKAISSTRLGFVGALACARCPVCLNVGRGESRIRVRNVSRIQ